MPNDSRCTWTRRALLAAAIVAVAGGCSHRSRGSNGPPPVAQQATYEPETPSPAPVATQSEIASKDSSIDKACPEPLARLEISSVDTANGVALVFATPAAEDVDALRIAVHRMAGEEPSPIASDRPPGSHAGSDVMSHDVADVQTVPPEKLEMVGTVAVDAKVIDTPDGAKIELTPKTATEVETLRGEVRQQVAAMQVALCPDEVSLN
jgi:hypothetical protein